MKRKRRIALVLSALIMATTLCSAVGCQNAAELDKGGFFPTVTIAQADGGVEYTPVLDGTPNKVTLPLLSGDIYTVCANYEKYITDGYNLQFEDCFAPTPLTVSWESQETPLYYTFDISTNEDMSNPDSYITFDTSVTLKNLFMGYDYYYQISAKYEDKLIKSRIFEFSTEYLPRTVLVDEEVSNTRDWGGYYVKGNKRMKQGIVYRGAALENITEAGKKVMLTELGIRTDLDVRGDSGSPLTSSPLGETVNYIETKGPYYASGTTGIQMPGEYQEALAKEIKTFADPKNFPIYVHCSLGRDRTGTLCFLIQALLGVEEMDIYRDYELSMMARTGKTAEDREAMAAYMVGISFTVMYNYIKKFEPYKTLQKNAEAYMLSIGVTEEEIAAIKENMLEEVK